MKGKVKKLLGLGLVAVTAAFLVTGCGQDTAKQADAAKGEKIIKVGTNATFVPFEFKNDKTNELEGYDIDVVKAIAKRINAKVEFKNISFDAIIPALLTKDIDLAATGMTITKARSEKISFSMPTYENGMAVVHNPEKGLTTVDDLKGKVIAVQLGTTSADLAAKIEGAKIKSFDHSSDALLELKNGGVDGAIIDLPVAQHYTNTHKDEKLAVIAYPDTKEYLGLGINKQDEALLKEVNAALEAMKKDGELNALYKKWFNTDMPADLPSQYEPK